MVGDNYQAAQAALQAAQRAASTPILLTTSLQGEASQAGRFLAAIARQIDRTGQPVARPACIIAGGETTVTLQGDGLGGRNQELVPGSRARSGWAGEHFAGHPGDGRRRWPHRRRRGGRQRRDAAASPELGLDPQHFLRRNDAYHFFEPLGGLLKTGPTLTNVNDLAFLFLF